MKKFLMFGYDERIVKKIIEKNNFVDVILDPWDLMDDIPNPLSNKERRIFVNDSTNIENVMGALQRNKIDEYYYIFSRYESTIIISSVITKFKSKNTFLDLETAINFRDKFTQKKSLLNKVKIADFQFIENVDFFNFDDLKIDFPIIMKPYNGAGTFLTFLVKDKKEFLEKLSVFSKEKKKSVLVEKFIEGEEYQIDGFLYKNDLVFLISKYGKPVLNISSGLILNSTTLNPIHSKKEYDELEKIIKKSLNCLGYEKGIFHMEFFKTDKDWIFSECGARIGGAFSNELFTSTYNKSLSDILSQILLEEDSIKIDFISKKLYSYSYIQPLNNRLKKLPKEEELKKQFQFLKKIFYEWKPGDEIPDTKINSVRRTGMVLIEGLNFKDMNNKIKIIYDFFENLKKTEHYEISDNK